MQVDAKKNPNNTSVTISKEMMTCYHELQELIAKHDECQERFLLEENGPDDIKCSAHLYSKIPKLQGATTTEWINFFMQTLSHSAVLPVTVYRHIIQLHPAVACALNEDDQLALHVAVDCRDPIPALVETLVQAAPPHTALIRDQDSGLLPIEIVNSHILAKEEAERYQNRRKHRLQSSAASTVNVICSDANWECVRLLAIRHARNSNVKLNHHCFRCADSTPVLHACLAAPDIPMSLTEKAIRRFPQQAAVVDECTGNLPLHIVAGQKRSEDVLVAVLKLHPESAQHANMLGCLPLDLAIAARRTWTAGGVGALVDAFPASLGLRGRFPTEHYPLVLSELLSRACPNTCFAILQASSNFL